MKIYRVGGAVRDAILGLPVKDIDYVVIGSSPEQMVAAGYTPVGNDFPVFLHPVTRAEYALARTERKSAPGYRGFIFHCAPDVTLEQDLLRRDLTINAMAIAENTEQGTTAEQTIIDPFGGQRDLFNRVFRHVSPAFSEDPVRILRVARFSARFYEFSIAPETMELMRSMVAAGEVDALVSERVWQEIARGLMESRPSRLFETLRESRALVRVMPELDRLWEDHMSNSASSDHGGQLWHGVDYAADCHQTLAVRWATILIELSSATFSEVSVEPVNAAPLLSLCMRLKVPTEVRDVALIACKEHRHICNLTSLSADSVVKLLERCDAFRRPERLTEIVQSVRCHYLLSPSDFIQHEFLERARAAALSIPSGLIAQTTAQRFPQQPRRIAEAIFDARVAAIQNLQPL